MIADQLAEKDAMDVEPSIPSKAFDPLGPLSKLNAGQSKASEMEAEPAVDGWCQGASVLRLATLRAALRTLGLRP